MRLELNQDGLCMQRKQLLRVRGGAGNAIVCQSGSVWVTQDGDQRDIILDAGESFVLDRNGPTLVQALEQSAVSFVQPAHLGRYAAAAKQSGRVRAGIAHAAVGV